MTHRRSKLKNRRKSARRHAFIKARRHRKYAHSTHGRRSRQDG